MSDVVQKESLQFFRPPAFPGSYFLSFEGIEGAGKSTRHRALKDHLEERGFRVLLIREPGGTSFGERLRKAILESHQKIHPLAEAHLFASARAQLLSEVILKELEEPGTVIIADRYLDSSLAYQGIGRGLGIQSILDLHRHFPLNLVPHLTFYLQIDVQVSHGRQKIRNAPKDYFESQGDKFYDKLIEGYDQVARLFPDRVQTINANRPFDEIQSDIRARLDKRVEDRTVTTGHHDED